MVQWVGVGALLIGLLLAALNVYFQPDVLAGDLGGRIHKSLFGDENSEDKE